MGLKKTKLAGFLVAYPTGRQICHTPILELDTNVGDVGPARKDRNPDGAHLCDGRSNQVQHDIEIMDHQIKDDVDIQTPRSESGQTMDFKKLRFGGHLYCRGDHGIEALDVTGLQDASMSCRSINEQAGFVQSSSNRFLHQEINTVLQEVNSNACVICCRYRKTNGIDLPEEVPVVGPCLGVVRLSDFSSTVRKDVDHPDQFGIWHFRV